jgi:hypothetical protein
VQRQPILTFIVTPTVPPFTQKPPKLRHAERHPVCPVSAAWRLQPDPRTMVVTIQDAMDFAAAEYLDSTPLIELIVKNV